MPGSQHGPSIKNPKVYEALRRKRGMPKSQAAAISNAMVKKASGVTGLAIPPIGPNALFNSPGIGGNIRTRRKRTKASKPNWGAKKGQTIIGGLGRGEGGRFTSSGSRRRSPERRAARQQRADERRAAREAEVAEEEAKRAEEDAYIAAGKTGRERQKRRAEIAAARRQRSTERRQRHAQEDADERATRQREDEEDATAEEAKPKGGGGGGGGKKKPTEDEKQQEKQRKAAANRAKTAPQAGLSPAEAEFLAGAASGTLSPGSFDAKHLTALGLVQDAGDTTEATDAGRRAIAALQSGDVRGALAAIQDGKARVAREAERQKPKPPKQAPTPTRLGANRGPLKPKLPRTPPGPLEPKPTDTGSDTTESKPVDRAANRALANQITRNLERRRGQRHRPNRRIGGITNVERRNRSQRRRKETYGGTQRSNLPDSVFAGPDRSFPIVTAQDVKDAARSLGRTKHDKAAVKRGIIRRARAIGATSALPESWREKATTDRARGWTVAHQAIARWEAGMHRWVGTSPSFSIFKGANGRDRWLAITTTAYQDKDAEWITRKAIRSVVAAGDSGAPRGPLRFWHVPGLDLGDCDYQASAFGDRVLIESGTFRSKAASRIGQEAARRGYQMSPGFLHTRREPRGGAFDHIALFERSFVPPGRASNPYTRLLTKEARMLTDEKKKEFEALAADEESRALLTQLLTQAETTVKEADAAGAVYKDAPAWAQALIARLDTLEATVKAPMPPVEMEEAGATELDDGAAGLEAEAMDDGMGDDLGGALDDEGFANMIVEKLIAAIGPMLELEKKMTGYLGEMKAMLQPTAAKDDARAKELADLQAANAAASAALDARLKELEGTQPRSVRRHYASGVWEDLTGMQVTKEQAAAITAKPPTEPPAGLTAQEQGAYALIFGDQ